AVFDFSMPLQNISATVSTGSVLLSVFDPTQGMSVQTNVNSLNPTNLTIGDGIAAWWGGYSTYCFTYDPFRTNWVGDSRFLLGGPALTPRINRGMVAWSEDPPGNEGPRVLCRLFDQSRGHWTGATTEERPGLLGFNTTDGVLMWASDSFIGYMAYDVASALW